MLLCTYETFSFFKISIYLQYACGRLPLLDDDRINFLIDNLHNIYVGESYADANDEKSINPINIDKYSRQHFPMCMQNIHEVLRSNHHLKHHCRLQYGLFLKAIGLSLEDAINFWREEFTKHMDVEKFEKNYLYNIKHQYGKVGRRTNYSPYNCMKIIASNVGPGEHHGCPFKHWNPSTLQKKLNDIGLRTQGNILFSFIQFI